MYSFNFSIRSNSSNVIPTTTTTDRILIQPPTSTNLIQFDEDEIDEEASNLSTWDTFSRKFKEQPLVPLGAGATTIALLAAGRAIQRGESNQFNLWCRYRIVFQGLTLIAALGGSLYYNRDRLEAQRVKEEERERMRVYQRDLRIRSQELSSSSPHHHHHPIPSSAVHDQSQLAQQSNKSLFEHQNHQIRKALIDRKLSDQQKHLDPVSSVRSDEDPSSTRQ